jgi:hypothetical protein
MAKLGVAATNRPASTCTRCRTRFDRLVDGYTRSVRSFLEPMSDQMYREVILDHYKNPRGHG